MDAIQIVCGLPETQRHAAANLYYEAFRRKLTPILGDAQTCIAILEASFTPQYALAALSGDRLVGIAGLHDHSGQLVNVGFAQIRAHYGLVSASARALLGALLLRPVRAGELLMDGIAVDAGWRGKGVGSRLLAAVFAYAQENGFRTVRLDVVDTNPDARRLYERQGFVAQVTHRYGWLTRWLGFTGSTTMIRPVA